MSGLLAGVAIAALWSFAACGRTPSDTNSPAPVPVKQTTAAPPPAFPPPQLSGNIPVALPPHDTLTPELARPFFDPCSWQSFVVLSWPVTPGARRIPNQPENPAVFQGGERDASGQTRCDGEGRKFTS